MWYSCFETMGKIDQNCKTMSKKLHFLSIAIASLLLAAVFSIGITYALLEGSMDGRGQNITAGVITLEMSLALPEGSEEFKYAPGDDLIDRGLEFELKYFFSRPSYIRLRLYFLTEREGHDEFTRAGLSTANPVPKVNFVPAPGFSYVNGSLYYDSEDYDDALDYEGLPPRTARTIRNIFEEINLRGGAGNFEFESGKLTLRLVVEIKQAGVAWNDSDLDWENAANAVIGV